MEVFGVGIDDIFFLLASIYIIFMMTVMIAVVVAALMIKRRVSQKINDIKRAPLRGKVFVTTLLKSLFK